MNINIKSLDIVAETAKDFIQKVITPPLEEVGLIFADRVKLWRLKNQVSIVTKAQKLLDEKNIKTKKVSIKVLAPLLEDCSLEENETLQEKWSKLLANTVSEKGRINSTLYSSILGQLSILDATVFDMIFKTCTNESSNGDKTLVVYIHYTAVHKDSFKSNDNSGDNEESIDNLIRLRLVKEVGPDNEMLTLSDLGFRFMMQCNYI
jgi:hypothetical protein